MATATCSDSEFIHLFETVGATEMARKLGIAERAVYRRRGAIEEEYGIDLKPPRETGGTVIQRLPFSITPVTLAGSFVSFSDCHWWGGYTDAFWILLQVIREVKPAVVICNGDAFDGARVSRHDRIGWDKRPTVKAELDAVKSCMDMIEDAAGEAEMYWNWGNHDMRFDTRLANQAPEYEGIPGMSLRDHFPQWRFQWGLMVNESCMVKHRYKGGVSAGRNNALYSGVSFVTGHDHHLQITPFSDLRGTRYGAQGGTLADPYGPQFDYTEGAPVDWQSGFIVGHFDGPDHRFEAVEVRNGKALFGGRIWRP